MRIHYYVPNKLLFTWYQDKTQYLSLVNAAIVGQVVQLKENDALPTKLH